MGQFKFFLMAFACLFSVSSYSQEKGFIEKDAYKSCIFQFDPLFCDALIARTKVVAGQAKQGGLIALDFFSEKVRPKLIKAYKTYDTQFGHKLGEYYWSAYSKMQPEIRDTYLRTKKYWYQKNPEFFDDISYMPTPVKMGQEKLLFAVWDAYESDIATKKVKLDGIYEVATVMLMDVSAVRKGKVKAPKADQDRLNRLLNDVRHASLDKEMANCFKIYAVPSEITNGFNTVCSIFINQPLYEMLNDDELRAVIAHEMGHGVNGDSVKTFATMVSIGAVHVSKVAIEGLHWLLTDETLDYFAEASKGGQMEMIMMQTADRAPIVEMTADMNGAKILNKAGYSANSLISALYKLHKVDPNVKPEKQESFRSYPSLMQRVNAIKSVMKF